MNDKEQSPDELQYRLSQAIVKVFEPLLIRILKALTWLVNQAISILQRFNRKNRGKQS